MGLRDIFQLLYARARGQAIMLLIAIEPNKVQYGFNLQS
jgi:hypothetical protein